MKILILNIFFLNLFLGSTNESINEDYLQSIPGTNQKGSVDDLKKPFNNEYTKHSSDVKLRLENTKEGQNVWQIADEFGLPGVKSARMSQIYKKLDVGQAIIIQNQLVLGLEAIEGTDELLKRCKEYKRKDDNGILFKFSKQNQSNLIDIPLIGLDTMKNLKKYNYEGVFLQKNKCLILDKKKIIDYASQNNLFISSVDLN